MTMSKRYRRVTACPVVLAAACAALTFLLFSPASQSGAGKPGRDHVQSLNLEALPSIPTLPWRCEATPREHSTEKWYFLQQAEAARGSWWQGRKGGAGSAQLPFWLLSDGVDHPHTSVCLWLQRHLSQSGGGAAAPAAAPAGSAAGAAAAAAAAAHTSPSPAWTTQPGPDWDAGWDWDRSPQFAGLPDPGSAGEGLRDFLVVAPMGTGFNVSRWITEPSNSSWDLIGLYYGNDTNFTCDLCRKVYTGQGPKWRLMYALYSHPDWHQLSQQYKAVMVADEGVALNTYSVNNAFSLMKEKDLLMAQPSICKKLSWRDRHKAPVVEKALKQHRQYILRTTTFVSAMIPIIRMDIFNNLVGPTLYNAYSGTGLDYIWPFLMHYPQGKLAVFDSACVYLDTAPAQALPAEWFPYGGDEEELRRFAEYGYFASEVEKLVGHSVYHDSLAIPERLLDVFSSVRNPKYFQPP